MARQIKISGDEGQLAIAGVADTFFSKGIGLLGRRSLPEGGGLLIKPCTSVHTFFMLFTIDVVFLTADYRVVKCLTMVPFRFALGGKGAKSVLELPAGTIQRTGLGAGDQLTFEELPA